MNIFLALVILALASARITRLVTEDTITFPLRMKLVKRFADSQHPLVVLFHCPWCIGFWISVLVVGSYWVWPSTWLLGFYSVWAVSFVAGRLNER